MANLFLFALLCFPFGILGYGAAVIGTGVFAFKQSTLSPKQIVVYSLITITLALIFALNTIVLFSIGGILLCFGSVIASPIALIALPTIGFSHLPPKDVLQKNILWLLIGWGSSGIMVVSPLAGVTLSEICNNHHRQQLFPVTRAIQIYYEEHEHAPTKVSELVPTYLDELPRLTCFQTAAYEMEDCDWGYVLFMDGWMSEVRYRYNPRTNGWATPNFLDGHCSFPND